MKRSWNPILWAGFALVAAGLASYPLLLARNQVTRDVPWTTLALLVAAAVALAVGIARAYRRPQEYRGKVAGPILASLSVLFAGLFFVLVLVIAKKLPASTNAPQAGDVVPDFTVADSLSQPVTLSTLLKQPFTTNTWPAPINADATTAAGKTAGAVLIFYRGYW